MTSLTTGATPPRHVIDVRHDRHRRLRLPRVRLRKDDLDEFVKMQENIGLLSALMLTILADALFNFADASTMLLAILTIFLLTSTLAYFMATTW